MQINSCNISLLFYEQRLPLHIIILYTLCILCPIVDLIVVKLLFAHPVANGTFGLEMQFYSDADCRCTHALMQEIQTCHRVLLDEQDVACGNNSKSSEIITIVTSLNHTKPI